MQAMTILETCCYVVEATNNEVLWRPSSHLGNIAAHYKYFTILFQRSRSQSYKEEWLHEYDTVYGPRVRVPDQARTGTCAPESPRAPTSPACLWCHSSAEGDAPDCVLTRS